MAAQHLAVQEHPLHLGIKCTAVSNHQQIQPAMHLLTAIANSYGYVLYNH